MSQTRSNVPVPVAAPPVAARGGLIPQQHQLNNKSSLPLSPLLVQRKLTLGKSDDAAEKEADRLAVQVTHMPEHDIRRKPVSPLSTRENPALSDANIKAPPIVHEVVSSPGQALDTRTRTHMESRFGHDFSRVRIHTDARAAESAGMLEARAYTAGNSVVFGGGQYAPGKNSGLGLLAHELTHVVQQAKQQSPEASTMTSDKASHQIQGSFFGDLWEGVKSVGRAVGGAITGVGRAIGGAITGAVKWIGERFRDLSQWVVNLIRDLPARLLRLGEAILDGLEGIVTFIPEAISALASGGISGFAGWLWEKVKAGGVWLLRLASRIFDVVGGPELTELLIHLMTHATPLTSPEKKAAQFVLGPNAIRWDDVRVAECGLWSIVFALNNNRAFATFHTINLPSSGPGSRADMSVVVHELTHVYQYETVGSLYLGQAIHAQTTTVGYLYGGPAGLTSDRAAGKHYRDYNREQQAQIAQDFYTLSMSGGDTSAYTPYIAELRAGQL